MAKKFAKRFYNSKAWQQCRTSYISKRQGIDGGLCEHCRERVGTIVHHVEHLTPSNINNPFITLSHDNLELVCHDCHNQIENHGLNKSAAPKLKFDSDGMILPPSES